MINYIEALSIILNVSQKKIKFLKNKKKFLINALGHISFNTIYSNKNIPHFNNSAMDGYAIFSKTSNNLSEFNVINKIKAGDFLELKNLNKTDAVEITTGSRLPSNFNIIIKINKGE